MSSSSQGSSHDDFDALGDVFMWEGKALEMGLWVLVCIELGVHLVPR